MHNRDKETNKYTKLYANWAQGARITPLQNCCNKRNVETTLSNANIALFSCFTM